MSLFPHWFPDWATDGQDWPNRPTSRFVTAGGLRWHVQVAGQGPTILLAHGTGAGTHSWRSLLPILARRFTVVAPDLPGHAFTGTPGGDGLSLPGMARAMGALVKALALPPTLVVGNSAGSAVLARMALDGTIAPAAHIGINAALLPFEGVAGTLFSPIARLLAGLPMVPALFAWRADRATVEKLLRDTGSIPDAAGIEFYTRLVRRPGHVAAALGMMAAWELRPLLEALPRLAAPLVLLVGGADRTVRPEDANRLRELLPAGMTRIVPLPGLGHLAHEERPAEVAGIIEALAAEHGVLAAENA
jgi:magnesium chelatase accessory protein